MGLGLCVVGCGDFAKTFAKDVRSFSGFGTEGSIDLYFASRDARKAKAYCRRFDGKDSFGSYEAAAADPRVAAMYICTPHHLHLEHTLLAVGRSKHVLVEKPIARTMEEGRAMVRAAANAGVKLMVAENKRCMPVVQKARELIKRGDVGVVRFIQIQEESIYAVGGWRTNREMMGGGVLIDGGIHSVDMLIDFAGMPEEVYASYLPQVLQQIEGEDGIVLMAKLESGGVGLINHAWGLSKRSRNLWVNISGTKGRIHFEPHRSFMTVETKAGTSDFKFPEDRNGIGSMVKEFRDSIAQDRPPLMTGEEGLRDLSVVLRAYESAASHKALPIK